MPDHAVITRPEYGRLLTDITLRLSSMPEVANLLAKLSLEVGKTPLETIILALIMLDIVEDVGRQGKRLAITDEDLNVVREILIPSHAHADA